MNINRQLLAEAVEKGLISEDQADRLRIFFDEKSKHIQSLRFTHILSYLGGLIAIGAMSLFMTLGWERFGGWGLFSIAMAYGVFGLGVTRLLLKRNLPIPAGITAAFVVVLTPLAVYGFQNALGWWPEGMTYRDYHTWIDWRWMFMEFATLACGALMLWRCRLPFLVMPVSVTLWYMSMDLAPFLLNDSDVSWDLRKIVSLWFGLLMVLLAFWVDIRSREDKDFAFWIYLAGVAAFWGGLSLMDSNNEWSRFLYFGVNLTMIMLGAMLSRRVFLVFGGLGSAGYLGHLAYDVFKDSLMFPFALTVIGFGIIGLGIVWQRHEKTIGQKLRSLFPSPLSDLIERRHG